MVVTWMFDFNYQAFGVDPNEGFDDAFDRELPAGRYLRVYVAEHYTAEQSRHMVDLKKRMQDLRPTSDALSGETRSMAGYSNKQNIFRRCASSASPQNRNSRGTFRAGNEQISEDHPVQLLPNQDEWRHNIKGQFLGTEERRFTKPYLGCS
jgi:hypothetical protein